MENQKLMALALSNARHFGLFYSEAAINPISKSEVMKYIDTYCFTNQIPQDNDYNFSKDQIRFLKTMPEGKIVMDFQDFRIKNTIVLFFGDFDQSYAKLVWDFPENRFVIFHSDKVKNCYSWPIASQFIKELLEKEPLLLNFLKSNPENSKFLTELGL